MGGGQLLEEGEGAVVFAAGDHRQAVLAGVAQVLRLGGDRRLELPERRPGSPSPPRPGPRRRSPSRPARRGGPSPPVRIIVRHQQRQGDGVGISSSGGAPPGRGWERAICLARARATGTDGRRKEHDGRPASATPPPPARPTSPNPRRPRAASPAQVDHMLGHDRPGRRRLRARSCDVRLVVFPEFAHAAPDLRDRRGAARPAGRPDPQRAHRPLRRQGAASTASTSRPAPSWRATTAIPGASSTRPA